MSGEQRRRRVNAAKETLRVITSYDAVANDDDRLEAVYSRVAEALADIFSHHCNSDGDVFTDKQRTCIEDVAFHIVMVLDAKNRQPKTELASIRKYIFSQDPFKKWSIILSIVTAVVLGIAQTLTWGYEVYKWKYPSEQNAGTESDKNKDQRTRDFDPFR